MIRRPASMVVAGQRVTWLDETRERDAGLTLCQWAAPVAIAPGQPVALARVGAWLDNDGQPCAAAWCVDWRGSEYQRADCPTLADAVDGCRRWLEALSVNALEDVAEVAA